LHFVFAPTKSYRNFFVENWLGVAQSQIRTCIFLIMGKNLLAGSQQWGNQHFFHGFSIFCSLSFGFFIVPILQGEPWTPPPAPLAGAYDPGLKNHEGFLN
jgi:hypothetical protein